MTTRETHLVELVDEHGTAIGSDTVLAAHTAPGELHRAFSVLLVDETGRTLLQQRAAVKTRFALRWANACCGHPVPGESVLTAADRRLGEELGVTGVTLVDVGVHLYKAADPLSGRVEYEYDHVLIGQVPSTLPVAPDPAEVAGVQWEAPARIRTRLAALPDSYAPWLAGVLEVWVQHG